MPIFEVFSFKEASAPFFVLLYFRGIRLYRSLSYKDTPASFNFYFALVSVRRIGMYENKSFVQQQGSGDSLMENTSSVFLSVFHVESS